MYIRKRKPITDDAKSKILATCNKDDHNGQPSDIEDSEYDPDSEHSGSESKGEEVEQKDNDKESPFEEGKVETRRQSRRASRSCTISKKESASKAAHSKSKSTRVGGTKSQCPVCKAMFARKDYTRKHMNKIHPEEAQLPENRSLGGLRRDYCDFCSKPFGNLSDHKRKSCRLNPNSVWSKKQEEKRHKHIANKALSQPKFIAAPPATQQITSLDIPDDPFLVQQVQNNATKPPTQQDLEKRGCNKIINSFTTFLTTSKIVHLNTARIYVAKMRKFLEFSESQNPLFIADLLLEMNRPSGIELPLPHQYILTCCNSSAASAMLCKAYAEFVHFLKLHMLREFNFNDPNVTGVEWRLERCKIEVEILSKQYNNRSDSRRQKQDVHEKYYIQQMIADKHLLVEEVLAYLFAFSEDSSVEDGNNLASANSPEEEEKQQDE